MVLYPQGNRDFEKTTAEPEKMTEIRMKSKDIEEIRKRLDLLLKDEGKYKIRYFFIQDKPIEFEKEVIYICTMLRGIGIRNDRERIPKPLRALRGRGRIVLVPKVVKP